MKFLLIAGLSVFSISSFANLEGKTFPEKKQAMTSKIDRKVEALQASRTCVDAAIDEVSLKQCHKDSKEAMEDIKESHGHDHDQREETLKDKTSPLENQKEEVFEEQTDSFDN